MASNTLTGIKSNNLKKVHDEMVARGIIVEQPKRHGGGIGHALKEAYHDVKSSVEDAASSVGHLTTAGVKYVEGDKEAAKRELETSVSKGIQASTVGIVSGNTADKIAHGVVKVAGSLAQPANSLINATYHTGESAFYLGKGIITGDSENYKKAQKSIAKAGGDMMAFSVGAATGGLGKLVAPGLISSAKQSGEMVTNYTTGNFNAGSQNLENITGWDVDNSKAEAAAEAAQKAAEEEVKKANQVAENERKAKLFALRKQVGIRNVGVASVWGSGSASSSVTKDNQTGIILG